MRIRPARLRVFVGRSCVLFQRCHEIANGRFNGVKAMRAIRAEPPSYPEVAAPPAESLVAVFYDVFRSRTFRCTRICNLGFPKALGANHWLFWFVWVCEDFTAPKMSKTNALFGSGVAFDDPGCSALGVFDCDEYAKHLSSHRSDNFH